MTYYPSYWERSVLLKPFDFAVLGAGIIGKQIAIKIKQKHPSARIALIDRYPVPYGASTRNAGFACFGSISEITDDFTRSPKEAVIALAEKRFRGIQQLVQEFGRDRIGYVHGGGYEIFETGKTEDLSLALENIDEINQLMKDATGLSNIFEHKTGSVSGIRCLNDYIYNSHEGMLNSGMLNETIAAKAHASGIVPFYGFNVDMFEQNTDGYRLFQTNGPALECRQLIIANNAFAARFLPDLDIVPARGQVIVTHPIDNLQLNGIYHSDKGYIYFRNIDNRVLIGGGRNHFYEEEETFDFKGSEKVKNFLENYLRTIVLPDTPFTVDMHWSGIMAMGREKLPIVKRINEHLLACVRMSGMGVALGPVLSDEVCDML